MIVSTCCVGLCKCRTRIGSVSTHLVCARVFLAGDDRFRQHRVHRELSHPPAQLRQFSPVIQRAQRIQKLQRTHERLAGRRIHELEPNQIVDTQRLQQEDDHA